MRKEIKRWGTSFVILIDAEDSRVYNLKEGDIVEIELQKVGDKNDN